MKNTTMNQVEEYYYNAGSNSGKIKICSFAGKFGYTDEQNIQMKEEAEARQYMLKSLSQAQHRNRGSLERE